MYSLLVVAILCAGANNVLLHMLSTKGRKYEPCLFNAILCSVWIICLFCYNLGWHHFSKNTLLWGVCYGVALTGFIFFKTMALTSGPIAPTTLIGCSSFVVTTIFNVIYWKESISIYEIIGILLMLVAVFLINYKPSKSKEKINIKWCIYTALFFCFSAVTGIIFRFHQAVDKQCTNEMMIIAALVATLILGIIATVKNITTRNKMECDALAKNGDTHNETESDLPEKKNTRIIMLIITLACGVLSCLYNRLNIYNAGALPSAIFFPVFNGGLVIISFFAGRFLFKEESTKFQIAGVVLGVVAILFFGRFFGLL